jgi:phosphatidylinositol-3-phosphatase
MRSFAAMLAVSLVMVACNGEPRGGASPAATATTPTPSAEPSPTPSPAPTPTARPHVFVIVMENASLATALRSPVIARMAATYALAANYHAVGSPSLPNYLALTSGSTWGVTDDGYHPLPAGGLGAQLTAAGISWRAYMEGLTGAGCIRSPYPYALKHDPFAYYGGKCPENVVSLDALAGDLAGATPSFVWITPGLCHDGHDCSLAEAGAWLDATIARITASAAWRDRGVLFIVWDEGDGVDRTLVPLMAAAPGMAPSRVEVRYDHYSLLAAIEDLLHVPRLGAAATADPLTELLSARGP